MVRAKLEGHVTISDDPVSPSPSRKIVNPPKINCQFP